MTSKSFTQIGLAVIATIAAAGIASAAVVVDPVAAPASPAATLVTGSGARANGPVELFVNGVSTGSVQANASGVWSKTVTIQSGDVLTAEPNQVWNFNTNGDAQGWVVAGTAGLAVTGGALVLTESGGDSNIGMHLTGVGILNDASLPVLEIGYRTTAPTPGLGTTLSMVDGSDTGFFGPAWKPTGGTTGYTLDVIDMTRTAFGVANADYPTGPAFQIGFAFNGIADGQTFEVDFVRMRETMRYNFTYDGDLQWSNPGFNNPAGAIAQTVTGPAAGKITVTSTGNGAGAIAPLATSGTTKDGNIYVNAGIFKNFNFKANITTTNGAGIIDLMFHNGSGFGQLASGKVYGVVAGENVYSTSFDGDANWVAGGAFINQFTYLQLYFPLAAAENMVIDYFEFAPTTFTGDSAAVTVSLGSSVEDWSVMH